MRALGGSAVNDDLLKSLWIQRLPNQIQAILSTSSESVENLAVMADKIAEVSSSDVNSIATNSYSVQEQVTELVRSVNELTSRFNKFTPVNQQSSYRSRSRSLSNKNSRSRSQTPKSGELCWFHKKFGNKATKCRLPCRFNSKSNSEN